jgi:multiple sugar transport system permease protein
MRTEQVGLARNLGAADVTRPATGETASIGYLIFDWLRESGWKHLVLCLFGFVMIYPLVYMLTGSLTAGDRFISDGSGGFTLQNYVNGWYSLTVPFGRFLFNSMLVSVLSILGNLISCSLAAYAFARLKFRFRRPMFAVMMATIMLPVQVTIIPQYIIFNRLGLVNSYVPLILPKFLGVDSFFIFLMVQFMRGLPATLDDAAKIDGCSPILTFWFVILPLCLPAIGVTAVFTFIWTWNDFFAPLLYLNSPDLFTVPLGLSAFQDSTGLTDYGALFAMSVVSLIPVFLVFLFAQKALVQGIATTGLK